MFKPLTFQPLTLWAQVTQTVALGTDCWGSKTAETVHFLSSIRHQKKRFLSVYPNLCDKLTSPDEGERGVTLSNSSSHCPIPITSLQQPESKSGLQRIYSCLWPSPSPAKKRLVLPLQSNNDNSVQTSEEPSEELVFINSNYQKTERNANC